MEPCDARLRGMAATPTSSVPSILSDRLELVWLTPEFIEAVLDGRRTDAATLIGASLPSGWPGRGGRERRILRVRLKEMQDAPESAAWLLRAVVRRDDREFVGRVNFHNPPDEFGVAELGYTVFEPHRRQGYASEAATAMMAWARAEHGIHHFRLSISPTNLPSLALAAKLGFARVGSRIDEIDGEEHVFELGVPGPAATHN